MHRQAPGKGKGVELTGAYVVSYYNLLCMVNYDCFDSDILLQFTTLPCLATVLVLVRLLRAFGALLLQCAAGIWPLLDRLNSN